MRPVEIRGSYNSPMVQSEMLRHANRENVQGSADPGGVNARAPALAELVAMAKEGLSPTWGLF